MQTTVKPKLNITEEFKTMYLDSLTEFQAYAHGLEEVTVRLENEIEELYCTDEGEVSAEGEAVKEALLEPLQDAYAYVENEIFKLEMDKLALLD